MYTGYTIADLMAHLACYSKFDGTVIPRRWDVILHHIFGSLWFPMSQWPTFRNAWNMMSIMWAVEITTIFLNLEWFGKYFKIPKLERISNISWVSV